MIFDIFNTIIRFYRMIVFDNTVRAPYSTSIVGHGLQKHRNV